MMKDKKYTLTEEELKDNRTYVGKLCHGAYDQTADFLEEIRHKLDRLKVSYEPHHTLSIYYDNPVEKAPEELCSFHGSLLAQGESVPEEIGSFEMEAGHYLKYTTWDIEMIWKAFEIANRFAMERALPLAESEPLLVSTYPNGKPLFEFYFLIAD